MSKLMEDDVMVIASLKGRVSQGKIAKMFGVSQPTIAAIHKGDRWGWLTGFVPANDNVPHVKAA